MYTVTNVVHQVRKLYPGLKDMELNFVFMGQMIHTHDGFSGANYTYQVFRNNNTNKQFMVATRTGQKKTVDYNNTALNYKGNIDKMIEYHFKVVSYGLSSAVIFVLLALANTIPVAGQLADAIALVLGGGYEIDNTVQFAETLILYHKTSGETTRLFNVL